MNLRSKEEQVGNKMSIRYFLDNNIQLTGTVPAWKLFCAYKAWLERHRIQAPLSTPIEFNREVLAYLPDAKLTLSPKDQTEHWTGFHLKGTENGKKA